MSRTRDPNRSPDHTRALAGLHDLAVETFNEHTLAGLAVGVVRGGDLAGFTGLGLADFASGRPVERDTVFRIGSISKTMTAIGVMQLVEEGRVGLDDPVNEHLRGFRVDGPGEAITIRHLLTHTGGLGELRRWSDLLRPTIGLAAKVGDPPPDLGAFYAPVLRAEVEPGRKWAYANHGFAVLGRLVEDVSGDPFVARMRARLFEPLGMHGTDFVRSERVRDRLAVGYKPGRRGLKPVKDREIAVAPAGSVFSSVEDIARYAAALTRGGEPVLRPETFRLMLEPQDGGDERLAAMGLAFMLDRVGTRRVAGHDGGWPGFVSALVVAPDDDAGVVVFTNTNVALAPHDLAEKLLRRLLGEETGDRAPVVESPQLWPELVGVYKPSRGLNTNFRWWPVLGGEVEVSVRRGHLTASAPSPVKDVRKGVRLHAADPDDPLAFEARHEKLVLPVLFERDAGGRVESVRTASTRGGFLRLYRRPRVTSLRLWARATAGASALACAVALARRRRRRRRTKS
jgi:CubicO group peptidase (beta-lactamase class C family)